MCSCCTNPSAASQPCPYGVEQRHSVCIESCQSTGYADLDHFRGVTKMIEVDKSRQIAKSGVEK